MKDDLVAGENLERVKRLVSSGSLPVRAREQGERLIERLSSTIRVALLGPKGIGKTQLLSALVRQEIKNPTTGPLVLSYGTATDTSYSTKQPHSSEMPVPAGCENPLSPCVTHLQIPSPILQNLQFLDVCTPNDPAEQTKTTNWALGCADIVLWCTETFDESEASYWAGVSEHLKDHSFLILTKVGDLVETGQVQDRLKMLETVAREEFHRLFATETSIMPGSGLAGIGPGSDFDINSGVGELRSALTGLADTGRRALNDAALLLIERYETPEIQATRWPDTEDLPKAPSDLQPPAQGNPEPSPADPVPSSEQAFYSDILQTLHINCLDMVPDSIKTLKACDARAVLDHCLETSETMANQFSGANHSSAEFSRLQEDIVCAADKMLLVAMEEGLEPATDAATILLQIKRELELRSAA